MTNLNLASRLPRNGLPLVVATPNPSVDDSPNSPGKALASSLADPVAEAEDDPAGMVGQVQSGGCKLVGGCKHD